MRQEERNVEPGGEKAGKIRLVVVVPGLQQSFRRWRGLVERLRQEEKLTRDECTWLMFDPRSRFLGRRGLADMARNLVARLDEAWVENGPYEEVILIGHSVGGLIARAAFVQGRGADPSHPQKHAWAGKVERIVLFAAPNRGIDLSRRPIARFGDWCLRQIPMASFTYWDGMRGSVFITNLRIHWIRLFAREADEAGTHAETGGDERPKLPSVVQVLGTRDRTVHREDSIDVLAFPNTVAAEVPDATHGDLPNLRKARDPEGRYQMLMAAILEPSRLGVGTVKGRQVGGGAKHVVFILHGIRASRIDDWLRQVADEVRRVYPAGTEVVRPAYGFFSALNFTRPSVRRRNIKAFQDAYTQSLARNRGADFDFIGHSNGTYMLGESLRDISGMTFRNVVLAGSVLPAEYPWDGKLGVQVQKVRSERGRKDWPVGWLCSALRGLGMRDVGTGGYSGFTRGLVEEELYHPGGHGSMFTPPNIERMVQFALGNAAGPLLQTQVGELGWWSVVSRLCPHLGRWLIGLILVGGAWLLANHVLAFGVLLLVLYLVYVILDVI